MSALPRLSLVVPAFNEVATIQRTLRAIRDYLTPRGFEFELIVSADGTDGTREAAAALVSELPVKVMGEPQRRGKGRGVREGVLAATGDIVGFLDADYKVAIDEIEKILPWFGQGYDVVFGSRKAPGGVMNCVRPWYRMIGTKGFALLMPPIVGLYGIGDTQCGFKFFRASVARDLFSRQRIDGGIFDVEILLLAARAGYKLKEVGVSWQDDGDSRHEFIAGNWQNLKDLFRIRFGTRKAA